MNKRNFWTGLMTMAFFVFFYVYSLQLRPEVALWSKIVCIAGAALSLANTILAGLKWKREAQTEAVSVFPLNSSQAARGLILLAIAVVWVLLVKIIGFLVTSVIAAAAIVLVFEPIKDKRHVILDVIATILFCVVIYSMFSLLGIHFPKGMLM